MKRVEGGEAITKFSHKGSVFPKENPGSDNRRAAQGQADKQHSQELNSAKLEALAFCTPLIPLVSLLFI